MPVTGQGLLRLAQVMDQLRSPGGCPWDAKQTHESLVQYLIEETFETVDAIDSGNREDLLEELGDLLLQVFFHARIAEEADVPFNVDDVANGISDKLIRRHPHVFPDAHGNLADSSETAIEANWQAVKNREKSRTSVTDGVPVSLPAFTQVNKLLQRLENASRPAPLHPTAEELAQSILDADVDPAQVVIALIAKLRAADQDPDALLRAGVRQFREHIVTVEQEKQ